VTWVTKAEAPPVSGVTRQPLSPAEGFPRQTEGDPMNTRRVRRIRGTRTARHQFSRNVYRCTLTVFAAVLCAASPSAGQDAVDLYDQTEAMLGWDPAPGPVAGYYVVVTRNDGTPTVDGVVTDTRATIQAELGDSIVVTVNAFDAAGVPGPMSDPSPMIRFNATPDEPPVEPPVEDPPVEPPVEDPPEEPPVEDPPVEPPVVAHAVPDDFTGNGSSDLLLTGELGFALWGLDPGAPPEELTPAEPVSPWRHAGSGDLDGNGAMDLVLQNDGSGDLVAMLFSAGNVTGGGLIDIEPGAGSGLWRVVGIADLDGDGRDDLVRRNTAGVQIVFMSGTAPTSSLQLDAGANETEIASIGDLDADGVDELVWFDEATRTLTLWDLRGDVVDVTPLAELGDGWRAIGAGDFDGDGADELFAHHDSGSLEAWRLDGPAILETLPLPAAPGATPLAVGDYDGDGNADLALHERATNRIVGWLSDGSGLSEELLLAPEEWAPPASDGLAARLCAADIDGDRKLTEVDRAAIVSCLGAPAIGDCATSDLDGNGHVADRDVAILDEHWRSRVCQGPAKPPKGKGKGRQ